MTRIGLFYFGVSKLDVNRSRRLVFTVHFAFLQPDWMAGITLFWNVYLSLRLEKGSEFDEMVKCFSE
jgi:hypothetical protein